MTGRGAGKGNRGATTSGQAHARRPAEGRRMPVRQAGARAPGDGNATRGARVANGAWVPGHGWEDPETPRWAGEAEGQAHAGAACRSGRPHGLSTPARRPKPVSPSGVTKPGLTSYQQGACGRRKHTRPPPSPAPPERPAAEEPPHASRGSGRLSITTSSLAQRRAGRGACPCGRPRLPRLLLTGSQGRTAPSSLDGCPPGLCAACPRGSGPPRLARCSPGLR